jgi:hypothetical protein
MACTAVVGRTEQRNFYEYNRCHCMGPLTVKLPEPGQFASPDIETQTLFTVYLSLASDASHDEDVTGDTAVRSTDSLANAATITTAAVSPEGAILRFVIYDRCCNVWGLQLKCA